MKTLHIALISVLIASSLEAYSRSIVIASYAKKEDAYKKLHSEKFQKYKKVLKYAQENDFEIHIRKMGKYFVIAAEPFFDKKKLKKSLKEIKKEFSSAFVSNYMGDKNYKKTDMKKNIKEKIEKEPQKSKRKPNKQYYIQEMQEVSENQGCSWIFGCEDE